MFSVYIAGPFQPSYELMLSFYGYYKQATEGQCTRPKPWAWDVVAKKKWFVFLSSLKMDFSLNELNLKGNNPKMGLKLC